MPQTGLLHEGNGGTPVIDHQDSPSGWQYHIRYTPKNGDKGPYWTGLFQTRIRAQQERDWYLKNGYDDAEIFVREVTPWSPLA